MSSRLVRGIAHTTALATCLVLASGCATTRPVAMDPRAGVTYSEREKRDDREYPAQTGIASYYGLQHDGRRTASGERYDMDAMTAAHRTLPFGTQVRVTNLENGRSVVVRINDRGPFKRGRVVDVSYAAARKLGLVQSGLARVRVETLRDPFAEQSPDDR